MTIFAVKYKDDITLFVSREIAQASINLSYSKVPERKNECEIEEIHVHDRVTHL